MKKYLGYHDEWTLPIKPGMKVRIPKGTMLRSMHPSKDGPYPAARAQTITVHHLMPGWSIPCNHVLNDRDMYELAEKNGVDLEEIEIWKLDNDIRYYNEMIPMGNPKIVWPGKGGYWVEADVNDIEVIND